MDILLYMTMIFSLGLVAIVRTKAFNGVHKANTAYSSCHIRKRFSKIRSIIFAISSIILLSIMYSKIDNIPDFQKSLILAWFTLFCIISFPLSEKRIDSLKDKYFILYLRGFIQDNYKATIKDLQKIIIEKNFSEGRFVHLMKQYLPVYAVGMTKELESPHGATRIYLDDKKWEKEVETLMQRASLIVILLNDSESCIWEIKQAFKFKEKVIFISDNQNKLNNIIETLKSTNDENCIPLGLRANSISFINKDGKNITIPLNHSDKDYSALINSIMASKFGLNRYIFSKKEEMIYYIIRIFVIFMIIVGVVLIETNPFSENISNPYLFLVVFIVLAFILNVPYLIREYLYKKKLSSIMSKITS